MLAGRKLLLADDSITIQKVVDLTFADEGVEVIAVNNGAEALEKLEEVTPDVVLADVFMPEVSGYQVCEHIKTNEKLKRIPVMLLVGSFEPLDETEARRVGADDILTKPFQSIRNLVDKVGALLGGGAQTQASAEASAAGPLPLTVQPTDRMEVHTAELPQPEVSDGADERLAAVGLEVTTANTRPLSPEALERAQPGTEEVQPVETRSEEKMEEYSTSAASYEEFGDTLLELGHLERASVTRDDDILEIDLGIPTPPGYAPGTAAPGAALGVQAALATETRVDASPTAHSEVVWTTPAAPVVEWNVGSLGEPFVEPSARAEAEVSQPPAPGQITLDQIAPEVVDLIARRAVEKLSERVIREIAWEVVPQLAELLIKRQLEEKESQLR